MKIFISGITGQLGFYLTKLFLEKGIEVVGGVRHSANFNPWRLKLGGFLEKIKLETFDLADQRSIDDAISKHKPEMLVNAAAMSYVGSSWDLGTYTLDVTGTGVYRVLEAVKKFSKETKIVQMSSSELFGNNPNPPYNEQSIFAPRSPYAIAKAVGYYSMVNFRDSFGMHLSNLISFNFESPLRGDSFVTKRIISKLARISSAIKHNGVFEPLTLGNLEAKRDWIYAGDTALAIYLMLQQEKPDDYVIGSGKSYSVRDFLIKSLRRLQFPNVQHHDGSVGNLLEYWTSNEARIVESCKSLYRPADVPHLKSDASWARKKLGWKPTKTLDQIIDEMAFFEETGKLV